MSLLNRGFLKNISDWATGKSEAAASTTNEMWLFINRQMDGGGNLLSDFIAVNDGLFLYVFLDSTTAPQVEYVVGSGSEEEVYEIGLVDVSPISGATQKRVMKGYISSNQASDYVRLRLSNKSSVERIFSLKIIPEIKEEKHHVIGAVSEPIQEGYKGLVSVLGHELVFENTNNSARIQAITTDQNGNSYTGRNGSGDIHRLSDLGHITLQIPTNASSIFGIAVSGDGNIFVSSWSSDPWIRKYDRNGNMIWQHNTRGLVDSMTLDNNGDVYFTDRDPHATIKLQDNGGSYTKVWESNHVNARKLDIDVRGDLIYVAGWNHRVTALNQSSADIDTSPTMEWESDSFGDNVDGVASDGDGFVYGASRSGHLRKFDQSGDQLWQYTHPAELHDVVVDSSGNPVIGSRDGSVMKFDKDTGNDFWRFKLYNDRVESLAVDIFDNIFIGYDSGSLLKIAGDLKIKGFRRLL